MSVRGDIAGCAQRILSPKRTTSPVEVAVGGASARSTLLPVGLYTLNADVDLYFLQGGSAVDAASTDHRLDAGDRELIHVSGADDGYVAVLQVSSGGTAKIGLL